MAPDRHRLSILALICTLCGLILGILRFTGFAPLLDLEFYGEDSVVRSPLSKRSDKRQDLVFVAIDQASMSPDEFQFRPEDIAESPTLRLMAEWPWPRNVYARIVDRLIESGARMVIFDVVFPTAREGDDEFRSVLDRRADKVVIGSTFIDADRAGAATTFQEPSESLIPSKTPLDDRVGLVNFQSDLDEVIRRLPYTTSASQLMGLPPMVDEERIPSLTARAVRKMGLENLVPESEKDFRFRFAGPSGTFQPYSVSELFAPSAWNAVPLNGGEFFRDKIVLVGAEGGQMKDEVDTPFGLMDGAEVHLNALNAVLNRDWLHEVGTAGALFFIAAGVFVAWLVSAVTERPVVRVAVLTVAAGAFILIAQLLFNYVGVFVPLATTILSLASAGTLCLAYDLVLEQVSKTQMRATLERYVSKEVAEQLLDNKESFLNVLGGVRRDVTVLFTDIRGFTAYSHRSDSADVVALLNEYFGEMVDIVLEHRGTLDKFIGDSIMAEWGTLHSEGVNRDAELAVAASLTMQERLARLNESWVSRGMPEMRVGIGINHGEAVVGNIGSQQKMELTVIGDSVNLASRLQDLTKTYRIPLLLGEAAARLVQGTYRLRTVDRVSVSGRAEALTIHTVAGRMDDEFPPERKRFLSTHEEGFADYLAGRFVEASACFEKCLEIDPGDLLAAFHLERCKRLASDVSPENWDGVTVYTSK